MAFTHLDVHSHFTFLGGTAGPAQLAAQAAAEGFTHLALTDSDGLYGAVAFARACEAAGVKPIIGLAAALRETRDPPLTDAVLPDQRGRDGPAAQPASSGANDAPGRLVLLAKDVEGYRSLCRLASLIQGGQEPHSLTWDDLAAHRAGLICLSGGRSGWLYRYLRVGDLAAAEVFAARLAGVFGDDACLALQLDGAADLDLHAGREITALGSRLGLPVVALQPVYCLERAAAARLRLLAAIRCNCRLGALPAAAMPEGDLHWVSGPEMAARYSAFPAAIAAAGEIAARCGPVLPDGQPIWPAVALPPGETPDSALRAQAQAGLDRKYGPQAPARVTARLDTELSAIAGHGFAPLFLAVAGIVRFARQNQIPVSTRGSVANSLAAYCVDITDVDPVANDLLFERFLSPARLDPPDIDLDLCSRRRDEVLEHVRATYGAEHVALVGTVSTLRLASAVRATAKAYGLSEADAGHLVARLPHIHYHRSSQGQADAELAEFLATLSDPTERAILDDARAIVGQPDHMSIHAGGVVITPGLLTDVVPIQPAPKGFLITQYEHDDVAALGLAKIDLLGIRALTVLADAAAWVRKHYDPNFHLEGIPAEDPLTGDLLARGETIGVFQCESDGARATLRKLKARTERDLAIANAFFKPGPSTGGMAATFVRRYRGEEAPAYLHPALEPILGATQGVLIFQEQVLRIATVLAGLDWAEADHLRRGMGRMQPREMADLQERFLAGCRRPPPAGPGLSAEQAGTLWGQVQAFAGFGFNQGHATAYAAVSYRSAYLRAHWPAAFLCARLADFGGFHHPVIYMAEAVRLGMSVRPPHVNHSREQFSLDPGLDGAPPVLWMGLGQVRDLRQAAVAAIVQARAAGPYAGLPDLLARVDLAGKEVQHLVQCGALDGLAASRAALLAEAALLAPGARGHAAGRSARRSPEPLPQQLAFAFDAPEVPPESASQRAAWEAAVLGVPLSALVDPRVLLPDGSAAGAPAGYTPLAAVLRDVPGRGARSSARAYTTWGTRLPGWPGGPGFHLWDGATLVTARLAKQLKTPPAWQPLALRGRVGSDGWGTTWLQVEDLRILAELRTAF